MNDLPTSDRPQPPPPGAKVCPTCRRAEAPPAPFDPEPHLLNLHRDRDGRELQPAWPYLPVAWRVAWFRADNSHGLIVPRPVVLENDRAVFEATVTREDGVWAVGHGSAERASAGRYSGRYIEKAATSAVGRALALLGYGTTMSGSELEDADNLADAPVDATPRASRRGRTGKGRAAARDGSEAAGREGAQGLLERGDHRATSQRR